MDDLQSDVPFEPAAAAFAGAVDSGHASARDSPDDVVPSESERASLEKCGHGQTEYNSKKRETRRSTDILAELLVWR